MSYNDERLQELRQKIYSKDGIKKKLEVVYKRKNELAKKLDELDKVRIKEEKDVEQLEKLSFASIICSIAGNKVEKLNKEKDEAYAATLKYETALKEYSAVCDNISYFENELEKIGELETEYEAVINEKFTYLKQSGNPQAEEIMRLDALIGRMCDEINEIDEALNAGEKVRATAEIVVGDLEAAEKCANRDFYTNGNYDYGKYSSLNKAKGHIDTLQIQLGSFRTELADVELDADLRIEIDGFTEFMDYFGDIFTEWNVLKKIRDLLSRAEKTRDEIISVMYRLDEMRDELYRDIKDTRKQVEDLVIDTKM